jgi:hypothetical protein
MDHTICTGSMPRVIEMRQLGFVIVLFCLSFSWTVEYGGYTRVNWRDVFFNLIHWGVGLSKQSSKECQECWYTNLPRFAKRK